MALHVGSRTQKAARNYLKKLGADQADAQAQQLPSDGAGPSTGQMAASPDQVCSAQLCLISACFDALCQGTEKKRREKSMPVGVGDVKLWIDQRRPCAVSGDGSSLDPHVFCLMTGFKHGVGCSF